MKITADNFPIYLALACTALSLLVHALGAILRTENPASKPSIWARRAYVASVALIAYATVYLLQQILSLARYDIDYISSYSGPNDPLLYRFSSLWAGHEGSLLFWALIGGIVGLSMLGRRSTPNWAAMAFWSSIQIFFLVLLVITDPFKVLKDYQPGMLGSGLRLELQNPWMAIHPPIVFLGYSALMVPAAMAIQALILGDLRRWAAKALPWAVFGWTSLGAGLILGMVWSYEELGWGGYWAWDPVENSSLVPWIISTALVHGLVMQRYKKRMAWPNVILAMSTFLTVICATFLTRSGVLSNVSRHSFADLGTDKYLLGFMIFYVIFCIGLALIRPRSTKPSPSRLPETSKDFAIALGAILFTLYGVATLIATVYPLFSKETIRPEFYTNISKPVAGLTIILIILASFINWSKADGQPACVKFNHKLWKSGSHIAHIGVILMVLGMVFSSFPKEMTTSRTVKLPEGSTKSALGFDLVYEGRDSDSDSETVNITATRAGRSLDIPLFIRYSERGAHARPSIARTITGDLYVAPNQIERVMVTPTASPTREGLVSMPVRIPGTDASLSITDVRVDDDAVGIRYLADGREPQELMLTQGSPAEIDGYALTFEGWATGDEQSMGQSVGAYVSVKGNGITESAIVEVSWKPYMWLLWLGTALITIGGLLATWRRFREKRIQDDGILPDSV